MPGAALYPSVSWISSRVRADSTFRRSHIHGIYDEISVSLKVLIIMVSYYSDVVVVGFPGLLAVAGHLRMLSRAQARWLTQLPKTLCKLHASDRPRSTYLHS